jgi:hypothetical protein
LNDITIFFVITFDSLLLRKYSSINNQLCLIEQIELKPTNIPENQWKINKAEFISETVKIIFLIQFSNQICILFSERNHHDHNYIRFKTFCRTL